MRFRDQATSHKRDRIVIVGPPYGEVEHAPSVCDRKLRHACQNELASFCRGPWVVDVENVAKSVSKTVSATGHDRLFASSLHVGLGLASSSVPTEEANVTSEDPDFQNASQKQQ